MELASTRSPEMSRNRRGYTIFSSPDGTCYHISIGGSKESRLSGCFRNPKVVIQDTSGKFGRRHLYPDRSTGEEPVFIAHSISAHRSDRSILREFPAVPDILPARSSDYT